MAPPATHTKKKTKNKSTEPLLVHESTTKGMEIEAHLCICTYLFHIKSILKVAVPLVGLMVSFCTTGSFGNIDIY